jgi:hypothetical protein
MMADTAWTGLPQVRQAMDYFQTQGWLPAQAAGIVSSLFEESNIAPGKSGDNGLAYGIAQWHPDRQHAFQEWSGNPIQGSPLEDQLGFVQHELTAGGDFGARAAGRELKTITAPYNAGSAFTHLYERPHDPDGAVADKRGQKAEELFNALQRTP